MTDKNPEYDFKWCPGCGDFGVRRALEQAVVATAHRDRGADRADRCRCRNWMFRQPRPPAGGRPALRHSWPARPDLAGGIRREVGPARPERHSGCGGRGLSQHRHGAHSAPGPAESQCLRGCHGQWGLWPDEGAELAHERDRNDHELDAVRQGGRGPQPPSGYT